MINYDCTYRRNKITISPGARFDSLHTAETTQKFALGTILELDDGTGRMFRYAKAGAAALSPHLMNAAPLLDAQQLAQIQTAYGASVGDIKFDILAATGHTITDNELKDGWLFCNDGAAGTMGDLYMINDNKFTTDDTVIEVELAEPLRRAILVTDDLTFIKNPCLDVIVCPTTKTNAGPVKGVARCTVAIGSYCWLQFRGWCGIIVDNGDTLVVNEPAGCPGTLGVAGTVGLVANDGTDAVWGTCVYASTGDEAAIINLMLP